MKWIIGLVAALGLLAAADQKVASDKVRIAALEAQVKGLTVELADEHEWADQTEQTIEVLSARTLDLHRAVLELERRGPVASR